MLKVKLSLIQSLGLAIVALLICGCPNNAATRSTAPQDSNRIIAVSYPLQFLTQSIVGDSVSVEFPIDSEDPQKWLPGREEIATMQSADLVVANGLGATYANWMVTVSLADSKRIDAATKGLSLRDYIAVEDVQVVHSHGPEGEHSHPTMVSRSWLDPAIADKQAQYIAERLEKRYPELAESIQQGMETLHGQLAGLSEQAKLVKAKVSPNGEELRARVMTINHEMKYLTRAVGLVDIHFGWTNESTLVEMQSDLAAAAKRGDVRSSGSETTETAHAKHILVPESMPKLMTEQVAALFKEFDLEIVPIDLIDKPDVGADFIRRLKRNLTRLEKIGEH